MSIAGGTNKSRYTINTVVMETARLGAFLTSKISNLPVGHSKNGADQTFANITVATTHQDYMNVL